MHSPCVVAAQRLDLAFNHLTDAGLTMLADALCRQLVDVSALSGLNALQALHLSGCLQLVDISALAWLLAMRSREPSDCKRARP